MIAGVAGVAAAIAIVVGIFAKSSSSTASLPSQPVAVAPVVAPPAPRPVAPTPAVTAPAAPQPNHVLFGVEPFDAHVFVGTEDLGVQPLTVDVPAGQKVTVEVRRDGFRPQQLTIDGSEKKVKLRLVKVPGARPAAPAPAKPAAEVAAPKPPPAPPALGGGEIVNPWAK